MGPWEISWIDKAYVFGRRFHHLELGLILIFAGWFLVIHDWFVYEKPKVSPTSLHKRSKVSTTYPPKLRQPASQRYTREKIRGMKPRSARNRRMWRTQVSEEELEEY